MERANCAKNNQESFGGRTVMKDYIDVLEDADGNNWYEINIEGYVTIISSEIYESSIEAVEAAKLFIKKHKLHIDPRAIIKAECEFI